MLQVQITARELVVVAAVLAAVVRQLLPRVALVAVKADIFSPDRVGLAAVLVMDRVVQVVPLETWVETEPVVVMTPLDLLTLVAAAAVGARRGAAMAYLLLAMQAARELNPTAIVLH